MNPNYSTTASDDDSDGEEELIETWTSTKSGTVVVVSQSHGEPTTPIMTVTQSASLESHARTENQKSANCQASAYLQQSKAGAALPVAEAFVPLRPKCPMQLASQEAPVAGWFLGGNHSVQLLISVDGDFDPLVLSKLTNVPTVVGELALSVESLVSEDATIGDFDEDLLAKIANNTLIAKRAAGSSSQALIVPTPAVVAAAIPRVVAVPAPPPTLAVTTPAILITGSVPNPLVSSYKPVPNPLARVTPPASPVPTNHKEEEEEVTSKRPSPTANAVPMRKTKMARTKLSTPSMAIKAL
jgi:hypothetical protein